ncbi:hypothetical protein Fmac_027029 [Flemingia macrophylla]|uniref:Uncharacterized protein n=1 Tax=Flemingia macrophylla TaxID=520843 RepID=A0ABD1LGJ8_9FABA
MLQGIRTSIPPHIGFPLLELAPTSIVVSFGCFDNLKSFPPSKPNPTSQVPTFSRKPTNITHQSPNFSPFKHNTDYGHASPNGEESLREKSKCGSFSSSSPSSDESSMSWVFRSTQKKGSKRTLAPPRLIF